MRIEDLGDPGRAELAGLAELATLATGTPAATIRAADSPDSELAGHGHSPGVLPSEDADRWCARVVAEARPACFPDSIGGQPLGSSVRFAAGHPLVGSDGSVLGALLVLDDHPHPDPGAADRALALLGPRVVDVLEHRSPRRPHGDRGAELRAYAGRLSHDLKNPLSAIRMSVDLAREEAPADGEIVHLLDRAGLAVDRLTGLIDAHTAEVDGG